MIRLNEKEKDKFISIIKANKIWLKEYSKIRTLCIDTSGCSTCPMDDKKFKRRFRSILHIPMYCGSKAITILDNLNEKKRIENNNTEKNNNIYSINNFYNLINKFIKC